jgi:hypothetical protein
MKMLKQVCLLACLPLLLEAAEVVRFDATAHVATNSPNTRYDFSLDPSAPMVSKSVTGGYSGPDVYGAMNMSSQGFWRVAGQPESGLSVRLNWSAGNWVNGLFLFPVESVRFSKDNDTLYASDIFTSQIHRLSSATIRFVVRAGGKFYISEPSSDFCRGGEGHQTDSFLIRALETKWFNYDPVTSAANVSVIGPPASPGLSRIDFVGFVLFAKGAEDTAGVNFGVREFSVSALK